MCRLSRAQWVAMVTGELKRQIDVVWNGFWSGGISNRGWCEIVFSQVSELLLSGRGTRFVGLRNALGRFAERV